MTNKNQKIKDKVERSGYRKSYIAEKIGTSLTQLSLHINGKRDLPVATEDRLKKFLAEKTR